MAVAIVAQRPRPERLFFLVATLVTVKSQPLAPVIVNAGGDDTCAVLEDRTTKCWGNNANGHLGLGDRENRGDEPGEMGNNLPVVDFGTGRYVVAMSSGYNHRCAILDNGALKCWGQGHKGQLGYEDDHSRGLLPGEMGDNLPEVNLGTGVRAVKIASGDYHQCAVLNNSKLKCWGEGEQGQIGTQTPDDRGHSPGQMGDNLPYVDLGVGRTVLDVTCGDYHTCVVMENRAIKCFGAASQGQLGYEDREERGKGDKPDQMGDFLPEVDLGTGHTAIKVAAGFYHTCALLDDYTVKCWGYGGAGQLGQESNQNIGRQVGEMGDALPAIDLGTGRTALDINTGATFTCALLDNYLVKCWGENHDGELGTGDTQSRGKTPGTMGNSLPPIDFGGSGIPTMITSGDKHSCAVLSDGFTKCWGLGKDGQLGFENDQTYGATPETLGERLPWVDFGATSTSSTTTSTTTASTSTQTTSTRSTSTLTTVTSTTTTVTTVSSTITSTTPIQSTTTAVTQDTTTAVTQDTTTAVTLDTTNPSPDAGSGSGDQTTSTQAVALVDGATTPATDATLSAATTTTLALAAATSTPVDGAAPSPPPADSGVTTTASGSTEAPSPDPASGTGAAETTVAAPATDGGASGTTLASSGSPLGQNITTTTPVSAISPGDGVSLSGTTQPAASGGAGTGADTPADPGAADPGAGTGTDTGTGSGTGADAGTGTGTGTGTDTGGGGSNSSAVGDGSGGSPTGGSANSSTSGPPGSGTDPGTGAGAGAGAGAGDGVSLLPAPGALTTPDPSGSQGGSSATAPPASGGSGGSAGGSDAGGSDTGGSGAGGSGAGGSGSGGPDAGSASGTTVGLATPPAAQPAGTSTTLGPTTIAPGATATPGDTYPAAGASVADSDLGFTPVLGLNPLRIMVQAVQGESWGGRASIAAGDQLLSINGVPVANMTPDEIFGLLAARPLNLTFTRGNGQPPAVAWTLAELRGCRLYEANAGQQDTQLGLSTSIVNGNLTVTGVQAGLWADLSQLVSGDLLLALNGKKVSEMAPSDTTQLLQTTRPLTLSLLRCGLTTTSWPSGPTTTTAMGPTGAPGDTPPAEGQTTPDVTMVAGPTSGGVSTTSGVASTDGTTTLGLLPTIEAQAQFSDTQLGLSWTGTPPAPVRLTTVDAGLWGARVGMVEGDVLVAINGQPVSSMTEDNVSIALQTTRPLTLKFAPSISLDPSKQRYTVVATGADVTLGFQPVGDPPNPVVVTQVQPGSWADRNGLKEGDQILGLNGVSQFSMSATELRSSLLQTRPLTLVLWGSPSQGQSTTGPAGAGTGAGMPMWATTNTTTVGEPWFQAELLANAGRQGVWHTLALTLAMVLLPLLTS